MGRFSRKEAESNGWVIVHEDEGQNLYRAEKYLDGSTKIEASGVTEGKLLEAISTQEAHMASFSEVEARPVDDSGLPVDQAGYPLRTVVAPDDELLTEAEWSKRGSADVIVDDEERHFYGPTEAAAEADALRQENAAEIENEAKAEPDVGPIEQVEQESLRDHQLQDVLIVREGEESLGEVIDRKLEESALAESDRADAGLGIGPVQIVKDEDGEPQPVPMGGPAEYFDPSDLPAGVPSAEKQAEAGQEAEIAAAQELRDEFDKAADSPEHAADASKAGAEAEQQVQDEAAESSSGEEVEAGQPGQDEQPQEGDIEATPAAEELAAEKGVDLKKVKGSGAEGKVTKPDVESHLEAQDGK